MRTLLMITHWLDTSPLVSERQQIYADEFRIIFVA